jgi:hypothetical protein
MEEKEQTKIDKEKELKLLHQALLLEESEVLAEGIDRLAKIGNASSIETIATLLCDERNISLEIKNQLIEVINTVQFENALPAYIEEIGKNIGKTNAHFLIAACWEANYECSKFIKAFAVIATHANAQELVECLSVFENIIIHPAHEDVIYSIQIIDNAIEKQSDNILKSLLISCKELISELA